MSKQKQIRTPGPWTIDNRDPNNISVVGSDGFDVAELNYLATSTAWHEANNKKRNPKHWGNDPKSHTERSEETLLANARLMAASPDLLAACKELISACRFHGYLRINTGAPSTPIKVAMRAIAKAELGATK